MAESSGSVQYLSRQLEACISMQCLSHGTILAFIGGIMIIFIGSVTVIIYLHFGFLNAVQLSCSR